MKRSIFLISIIITILLIFIFIISYFFKFQVLPLRKDQNIIISLNSFKKEINPLIIDTQQIQEGKTILLNNPSQEIFYVITLKVKNNRNELMTIYPSMIRIIDQNNIFYFPLAEKQTISNISKKTFSFFSQPIQGKTSFIGEIIFKLPETAVNPVLKIEHPFLPNGITTINLN